jgi:hypothetical protein
MKLEGISLTLNECRVWTKLHFWAMRESGVVEKSPSFADYYLFFLIGRFIKVYEASAPAFVLLIQRTLNVILLMGGVC